MHTPLFVPTPTPTRRLGRLPGMTAALSLGAAGAIGLCSLLGSPAIAAQGDDDIGVA